MTVSQRILILGARSWLGSRLAEALKNAMPMVEIVGTTTQAHPTGGPSIRWETARSAADILPIARRDSPHAVINLLWWDDTEAFAAHLAAASWCADNGAHYSFASSALALDGYPRTQSLEEDLPARSVTPYGRQKARCENDMTERRDLSYLIVRFASMHGWSPWKMSRTEALLRNVRAGRRVRVAQGIRQNRLLDLELARAWTDLLEARTTGIVHLGTTDSSDELTFLRRLAETFGWRPDRLVADGTRDVNLAVQPRRVLEMFGQRYALTEEDTLRGLLAYPELEALRGNEI